MDDKQQFSITGDTANKEKAFTTGSLDNELFKQYTVVSTEKGKFRLQLESEYKLAKSKDDSTRYREQLIKLEKEMEVYRAEIIKKHPTSLLTTLFNTMKRPTAPAIPVVNGKPDSLYPYRFVKDHYWDEVEFNDNRLLRTPFFEPKLDEYFKYYVSPDPDSIIAEVNYMLLSARSGAEIYPYLLTKFTNKYINPEYMGQDRVFVYLFENYYAKGDTILLNPASRKTITDRAYSLMANQLGLPAPALNLVDTAGKNISLYSTKSSFTLVAFWDPTCGHCKEEVPQIDSIYKAKWKALGVSVFSVNVNEKEVPAWKKFIKDKNLSKTWIHAHQLKEDRQAEERAGKPNFRQLYDIYKTPTLYLLDADKRIIAKQLSLQQFDNIITVKLKK
jgi:thiol-disulfide isomerase/thioredoxin